MSSPTGSDPNYVQGGAPQGQPTWGAPQPPPPYGAPAPSYSGGMAAFSAAGVGRPVQVMVAAILGFVVALFALLAALGSFALSALLGLFAVIGILYLAIAAVNIWGGIVALMGKGSTVLKVAGLITAGLAVLGLILSLTQASFSVWSILLIIAGGATFFLLNQPQSRQYFAARGAK